MSSQLETGKIVEGKVKSIAPFGAFVELEGGVQGLVHISEISFGYVKEVSDHLKVGDVVKVKILAEGKNGRLDLSIKQANARQPKPEFKPAPADTKMSFEDMLSKFKKESDEKMSFLKTGIKEQRRNRG
ncbi:MAG: S1 RNA-binding domain-containing protein [Clostridia bacterium]|nr:S1 RNA-binding domain-containing protein [Clostridia bacterium]